MDSPAPDLAEPPCASCVELRKIIDIQDQALRDANVASGRADETIRRTVGSAILATNGILASLGMPMPMAPPR